MGWCVEARRADRPDPYCSNGIDQKEYKDATLAMGRREEHLPLQGFEQLFFQRHGRHLTDNCPAVSNGTYPKQSRVIRLREALRTGRAMNQILNANGLAKSCHAL